MDCGSVTNERPKRRRRLLLSLVAGRGGGPGGRGVPTRHLLPGLLGGLGALRLRAPAARGGASRASPLLLLLLLPSPRLAAASPRRPLADWERSRAGPSAALAGRGCARRCQPGLAPGVTCAAGAVHLCLGQVAALASSRRELSVCAGSLHLESKRRDFTSSRSRKLYFDTHAFVCLLEENGFTTQQAEIIVSALVKIMEANMDIVYKDMVTKMQQEITLQEIMSQIANVKKDMIILEKSEFSALRSENEYSLNERKLLEVKTEMVSLHAQQDRAITQTDRKIDTEVAGLKTMLESHKLDNIKYLAVDFITLSGGGRSKEDSTQLGQ
ncbi:mitochondrial calcium uniporter regulator 1 isoform X4 [Lagenorhynchus albirostris]|uniref:mitochondrial calcium uniporter regulator 1 isoform X4 n=1 Tax=Lagenorhynchus albirostris TaxID=27610 RepID=UPI0028E852BC|nr:mitochondrial calcium uniporter regulator 1 isoform X4 [Lagenorhynchus albirostris]